MDIFVPAGLGNDSVTSLLGSLDWTSTGLGSPESWPECLKATLDIILPSRAQIVLFWGPEFIALYNDAYIPTIGHKHPAAFGRPAHQNWSELWDDLEPLLKRVLYDGETVSARDRPFYIERHDDPEQVYFDISYSPIRDCSGEARGVFCVVTETTERVNVERSLRKSQEQLTCALEAANMVGLFDWDMVTDSVEGDVRFAQLFSIDPGAAKEGVPVAALIKGIHPDDRKRVWEAIQRIKASGQKFIEEYRVYCSDGTLRWIDAHGRCLYDDKGKPLRFTGAVIDVTTRKRTEDHINQLAAIIASSDDAIISTDLDMIVRSWNDGAARLYGYTADEIIGKSVTQLMPPDRVPEAERTMRLITRGERVDTHETKRRRRNGDVFDVSLTISPVFDEYGKIIGASKIARDITAAKEAGRLTRVLMGELKHRVKNVLATVQAIARQTFGHSSADPVAIETFTARLAALGRAHDLLTRESWEDAELSSIVRETLAPYAIQRFTIEGPALKLRPRSVVAMSLALHELATNAAKYGALSVPGGHVDIAWSLHDDAQPTFSLSWCETGGPPVDTPSEKGFGSKLITQILAAELSGDVQLAYERTGIRCTVTAPVEADITEPD